MLRSVLVMTDQEDIVAIYAIELDHLHSLQSGDAIDGEFIAAARRLATERGLFGAQAPRTLDFLLVPD